SETSKPSTRSSPRTSAPSASSFATIARPMPPDAPVTRAVSGNKNDLPGRLAGSDQLLRLVHLLERELGADHRPEGTAAPQREQLVNLLLDELGPEAHQAAEVEAQDPHVPADEPRRVDRLPRTAREAD